LNPTTPCEGYAAMAARAQGMYDQGRSAREVLDECYGTALPDELFAIAYADGVRTGPLYLTNQPWRLIVRDGRVSAEPEQPDEYEQAVIKLDPDLLPLATLLEEDDARHGDSMLCYRLSALAAGDTAVYGLKGAVWELPESLPAEVPRYGDSLLNVLGEYFADIYHQMEERYYGPGNTMPSEMLDRAESLVDLIDRLKRDPVFGPEGQG